MKIGISYRRDWAPEGLTAYAKRAEKAGFNQLWVVEDSFYASGIASAAAALASTESIDVGLGIMPSVARNPVFTAMEIATIAGMFPNRFRPGIGHGVKRWMQQIGALAKSQMAALEDAVTITKKLMAGEVVTYQGKQFLVDEGKLVHPPAQVPPIYLGVRGPKSLALSGRIADGTILAEFSSPAYVKWAKNKIEAAQGTKGKKHHITMFSYACTGDSADAVREQVRPLVANAIASGRKDMYFTPFNEPDILEALRLISDNEEMAGRIPDEWIDQMAVVGSKEDWLRSFQKFENAGVDSLVLVPLRGKDQDELDKFADAVYYH